jgi:hypothetical protein
MFTPPIEIIQLMAAFASAFTAPTFRKVQILVYGAILAPGRRTVASALRAAGCGQTPDFSTFHRVLNRNHWSMWSVSRILLSLLIDRCLQSDDPLLIVVDDTLERRTGRRIRYKAWYHDAARSTPSRVATALGIRWLCLALIVPVPWSRRRWALPFLSFPALSAKLCRKLGKPERSLVDWTAILIKRVRRWQPHRRIILVGDGAFAAMPLLQGCQELSVQLVSRLRLDSRLFALPVSPLGRRGPKAKKGVREPKLEDRLHDPQTVWTDYLAPWYDGQQRVLQYVTGVSLWHRPGYRPGLIRWVLVRPAGQDERDARMRPAAFFCSDPNVDAKQIIHVYVARWNIEVTFQELRTSFGFETQRQWSNRAVERTTPCLFGLFSLVVLMAQTRYPVTLPIRRASWYVKEEATFSDVLACIRHDLWRSFNCTTSSSTHNQSQFDPGLLDSLLEAACYAA